MGRRSINTTKSGKYMNPTDQARKEARKKELKKNKKQRQMVRAAVLKMKDPSQILEELQKIDEMEYNVLQPSPLNEKVLKEKRKKLKETLDRVLKMYDKDEPDKWVELKRQEAEYERRRSALAAYYESVKHAQAVQVDDIPLPTLQVPDNLLFGNVPSQIPLPIDTKPNSGQKPTGILKKDSVYNEKHPDLEPPGVPPFPPPNLTDLSDGEDADITTATKWNIHKTLRFSDQVEENEKILEKQPEVSKHIETEMQHMDHDNIGHSMTGSINDADLSSSAMKAVKPTSLQQRMLALSGQNIEDFMKEMEEVHKKRERNRAAELNSRLAALGEKPRDYSMEDDDNQIDKDDRINSNSVLCPPGTSLDTLANSQIRPPPLMGTLIRPPPLRPIGMPLGNRPTPPGPPPGLPPRLIRLPPGPPPGLPPRGIPMPLGPTLPPHPSMPIPLPVLSAAPQLINRKDGQQGQSATITAKPQIRNLSADVTRFIPSALRVKREDKKAKPGSSKHPQIDTIKKTMEPSQKPPGAPTKDDAYMQFMQEMQGLL